MKRHLIGVIVMSTLVSALFLVRVSAQEIPAQEISAGDISVEQIVNKANLMAFYQAVDGRARVSMTITDSMGRERKRSFIILRKDIEDGGEQKYYIFFKKPADVRNMVFMVWKHINTDDDRWLYLPALDLVKRIASNDKRTSFVGSHFLYEDVSGRGLEEDTHELIEQTDTFYVVKNVPKIPQDVEFDSYTVWIDKNTFMPLKIEYYQQGEKYRVIESVETKEVNGYLTVTKSKASDLRTGGFTVSEFGKVEYDINLDEKIFTERYLRQAPRKWLR